MFDDIASFPALHAGALRAARGKRSKPGPTAFLANPETEVLRLERELQSGRYRPGRYKTIEIFDPRHRIVSAAPHPLDQFEQEFEYISSGVAPRHFVM